jgi:hypothetical protein
MESSDIESLRAKLKGNSVAEEVYAQVENYDMAKGIMRPVSLGEKHQMHVKVHEKLLANPNTKQDIKLLIMQHVADHRAQEGLEAAQKNVGTTEAEVVEAEPAPPPVLPAPPAAPEAPPVIG